jgi:hypothetical protein
MARYVISDSYAATVLPIIREIHREILAGKPRGAGDCATGCGPLSCAGARGGFHAGPPASLTKAADRGSALPASLTNPRTVFHG